MKGLVLDENGDLLVAKGRAVLGDADGQVIETVLRANRGELKEIPLIGGEVVRNMGGSTPSSLWCVGVKKQLQSVGVEVNSVSASDNEITVKR